MLVLFSFFLSMSLSFSMAFKKNPCIIFLSLFAATRCFDKSCGWEYRVGDSVWSIPPYPHYYSDWSTGHLFYAGDSLVFDFETEFSNLVEIEPLDYQTCAANNPIKIFNSAPATILLQEAGVFYFMCNLSNYCDLGQKISIIVQQGRTNFPPTPPASPLPVAPTVSSPTPVAAPLPVTPKDSSPGPAMSGNWNRSDFPPPMPARSDNAPSPTTDMRQTHSSSKGSGPGFSVKSTGLLFCSIPFIFGYFYG